MALLPYSVSRQAVLFTSGPVTSQNASLGASIATPDSIRLLGYDVFSRDLVRDDTEGYPLPPSQKQQRPGIIGGISIPCTANVFLTIQISCKFTPNSAPYPRIFIKNNPNVGLNDDLSVSAIAGTGWQTLVLSFTPIDNGVVQLYRQLYQGSVNWDNLQTSE